MQICENTAGFIFLTFFGYFCKIFKNYIKIRHDFMPIIPGKLLTKIFNNDNFHLCKDNLSSFKSKLSGNTSKTWKRQICENTAGFILPTSIRKLAFCFEEIFWNEPLNQVKHLCGKY